MKVYIILLFFIAIISCNKKLSYQDEITAYLVKNFQKKIKKGETFELKLIKFDSLNEKNQTDALKGFVIYNLIRLNNRQNNEFKNFDKINDKKKIDSLKLFLIQIHDSVNYYKRVGDKIYELNPDNKKIIYYFTEYLFILKDKSNHVIKKDTLHYYIDKRKVIFSERDLVKKQLVKYSK